MHLHRKQTLALNGFPRKETETVFSGRGLEGVRVDDLKVVEWIMGGGSDERKQWGTKPYVVGWEGRGLLVMLFLCVVFVFGVGERFWRL